MTQRKPVRAVANGTYSTNENGLWLWADVIDGPKEAKDRHATVWLDTASLASLLDFMANTYPDALLAVAGALSACDSQASSGRPGYKRGESSPGGVAGARRRTALRQAARYSFTDTKMPIQQEVSE